MAEPDSQDIIRQGEVQAEVFAFLAGANASPATRIDTHGAVVFLTGDDVYKVKRAVRFPFMDFSSLEKRRIACEHEIAVNRRNAPEIYLGTVPIRRDGKELHLGGAHGEIVEWAVHLVRFDETQTFDKLAERGALDLALMEPLAETIASAHALAPRDGAEAIPIFRRRLEDTLDGLAAARDIFPGADLRAFSDELRRQFDLVEPLLRQRAEAGYVRLVHGDLHLRNIALHQGRPLLFDAIEFDDSIATCDILYDFAFLLMDLTQRGLKIHANRVFNLYLWKIREIDETIDGLAALPLFLALRAAIRARVTVALSRIEPKAREARIAEAGRFFAAAQVFLVPNPARLIAIGGLSGSGKSTLAKGLAAFIGRAPGAVHLRSDIERKRLFNVNAHEPLPHDAYQLEVTEKVYARLRSLAEHALKAGQSVVVDAVHARPDERDALEAVANRLGVPFWSFWLDAPAEILIERVKARTNDASDADTSVVEAQIGFDRGAMRWHVLDARQPLDKLKSSALSAITPAVE
jgi:aminoglycoside phosphotransferase family enzyme/predicted kinase